MLSSAIEPYLIVYKQLLAVKNQRTNRYISAASPRPMASASHPFLEDTPLELSSHVLQILNAQNAEYGGPLILGALVMLCSPVAGFMVCHANGEIRFEKLSMTDAQLAKTTKFMLLDANNLHSKRQVTIYDDLVFKYNEGTLPSISKATFLISELSMHVNWNGANIAVDSSWKLQKATCPPMPDWLYLRPNISLSYLSPQTEAYLPSQLNTNYLIKKEDRKTLGSHPPNVQQILLIEDLLYCMMGIEGTYIRKRLTTLQRDCFEYAIEPTLDQPTCEISLQQMVNKILPMCQHHDEVEFYVVQKSKFDYGRVSQALCSALGVLTKEYLTMINQLDNEFVSGDLTLQKLWYYLQPSIKVMQSLHILVSETQSLIGGALISKIYDLINSHTDRQVISVFSFLVERAFAPYILQLDRWLYCGEIEDTFGEFLVQEKKTLLKAQLNQEYRDSYWEQRFTIRQSQVPRFLERLQETILRTGKYLNVARESTQHQQLMQNELLSNREQLIRSQDFSQVAQNAFDHANKQIIDLLFKKEDLMGRLRTIKRFFMMECGDFFIHFLELAEEELSKTPKLISKEKLESLLDVSVRSVAVTDPYKEEITGYLDSYTIMEQIYALQNLKGNELLNMSSGTVHSSSASLRGIDLFTIDLRVMWPLNLILSRTSMVKYQIIFKSLFYFKYIERQLNNTWLLHQTVKELGLQKLFARSHALLQKMLHFMKSYLYYFTYEVVEQHFAAMEAKLMHPDSFESVLAHHNRFIEMCLSESLLLNPSFMKTLMRMTQCCLTFSKSMQRFTATITRNDLTSIMEHETFKSESQRRKHWLEETRMQIKKLIAEQSYNSVVGSFAKSFQEASRDLVRILYSLIANQHNYLIGLVTRLDFDGGGYHNEQLLR